MQKKLIIIGIAVLGIVFSCTKLDVKPYNLMLKEDLKPSIAEIGITYVAPAYTQLRQIAGSNQSGSLGDLYQGQSFCTDEALTPTRGGDWYDGGHFQRLFEHTWTAETPDMNTMWKIGFNPVSIANQNIALIQQKYAGNPEVTRPFIEELRSVRSLGYYFLIDLFGNVPIVTSYDSTHKVVPNQEDFTLGRNMLFDTIVSDLITSLPYLSGKNDFTTWGSFNKWSGYALLAKMYINAKEWTGTAKNDECIAVCDSIINSGKFTLEANYFANFKVNNAASTENIFVVPYNINSSELLEGFFYMSQHYNSNLKYGTRGAAWNGFCCLPDHYHAFDANDVRRDSWTAGPQFAADGVTPLRMIRAPYVNQNLNFTPDFRDIYGTPPFRGDSLDYAHALENNGARLQKYEISNGLPHTVLGVALPIFRYADILMLKAEAIMRNNGGVATQEAVDLVNRIRVRAGVTPYTTGTLTMDELLAERGREFSYEAIRRQDLIRFGKFLGGTWGKNFSGPYQTQWFSRADDLAKPWRSTYPIPSVQISATGSDNLHQRHGY